MINKPPDEWTVVELGNWLLLESAKCLLTGRSEILRACAEKLAELERENKDLRKLEDTMISKLVKTVMSLAAASLFLLLVDVLWATPVLTETAVRQVENSWEPFYTLQGLGFVRTWFFLGTAIIVLVVNWIIWKQDLIHWGEGLRDFFKKTRRKEDA